MRRRFCTVGDRRVHYWRSGDGPPCVLIHSSPANARLLMKEIERLSAHWTVFAFDTPGFGQSDPLARTEMEVADLADALAETFATIAMPPCPIFGTHTGAAIALEFGVRHPERATGLVLDGVPVFTDEECARYFGDYFRKFPVTILGGHYAEVWTRFRDQSIWFPWSERLAENLNGYDLSSPHSTHLWTSMFFEAADHYTPAYRAASYYGAKAIAAAAQLTRPAVYTATETDMLYPHLARLPELKSGQEIREIGNSYERKRDLIAESFKRYGARGDAPKDIDTIESSTDVARQFVDGSAGQLHLRFCGDRNAAALLLLHDAPGSSEQLEPLIARLGMDFFVVAPDLPGNGESDAFAGTPNIAAFADEAVDLLDLLGIDCSVVYGVGFGSSVAVEIAQRVPKRVSALCLRGLALPTADERARLRVQIAPPIAIEPDGAHWYRTWLMLRDGLVYWPWFDRRLGALRRVQADFDPARLHRWTMDVMRAHASYHHLPHAALDHDASEIVSKLSVPLVIIVDPAVPLCAYDDRLRSLCPDATVLDVAAGANEINAAMSNAGC